MKKLLIWDGDNTLWPGVLMEGASVQVPPERVALCLELADRGVLQAVASFNLMEDVQRVLMAAGLDQVFLYNQAQLHGQKGAMVAAIKDAYELSRWSDVVFVDDEPYNLAEVQSLFPEVRTIPPALLAATVNADFTKPAYTQEDRLRVRRYRVEQQRVQAAQSYGSDYQAFLQSCELRLYPAAAQRRDLPRIVDLVTRANRMAALAFPMSEEFLRTHLSELWIARAEDRFGDYGLSAIALVSPGSQLQRIEAFVVSCRLQGRGVGSAFLGWLLQHGSTAATYGMEAAWTETEYNAGLRGLFEWYGFKCSPGPEVLARLSREEAQQVVTRMPSWVAVS